MKCLTSSSLADTTQACEDFDLTSQVSQGDAGRGMVFGEFHSMTAIHKVSPDLAPKPIGWGFYEKEPDTYFFLCAFTT
jgi:hypothetical protein